MEYAEKIEAIKRMDVIEVMIRSDTPLAKAGDEVKVVISKY